MGAKEVCQDILKLHERYDFVESQSVEFILEPHFQYDASHDSGNSNLSPIFFFLFLRGNGQGPFAEIGRGGLA